MKLNSLFLQSTFLIVLPFILASCMENTPVNYESKLMPSDGGQESLVQEPVIPFPYQVSADVERAIAQLPLWRSDRPLLPEEWARLRVVAARLQVTNVQALRSGIEGYDRDIGSSTLVGGNSEPATRVFILLRVMFELPEDRVPQGVVQSGGWVRDDKTTTPNAAWPISWNDGRPVLLQKYLGRFGTRYEPLREFDSMYAAVPFRDLAEGAATGNKE